MRRILNTPLGPMTAQTEDGSLTSLRFGGEGEDTEGTPAEAALLERLERELTEYTQGQRRDFTLPLRASGTDFQRQVWQALLDIPYGERRTYGELAAAIGRPGSARAVGRACARNPIVVLIPCHRVVGADGSLTGYSAEGGTERKRALLLLEQGKAVGNRQ